MTPSLGRWIDGDDVAAAIRFDAQAERGSLRGEFIRCAHRGGWLSPPVRHTMALVEEQAGGSAVVSIHKNDQVSVRCVDRVARTRAPAKVDMLTQSVQSVCSLLGSECTALSSDSSHAVVPSSCASGLRGVSALSHAVGLHHARAFRGTVFVLSAASVPVGRAPGIIGTASLASRVTTAISPGSAMGARFTSLNVLQPVRRAVLREPLLAHPSEVSSFTEAWNAKAGSGPEDGHGDEQSDDDDHRR